MKIKTVKTSYEAVTSRRVPRTRRPKRPNFLFRSLVQALSLFGTAGIDLKLQKEDLSAVGKGPYLILMNHSCFLDPQIASRLLYPKPYGIVTTTDGFVGKEWIMRQIGCIPTQKFVSDLRLIRDMDYMLKKNKTSVLMYPEAGYSLDGRATVLPRKIGGLLKILKVPVLFIFVEGAFLHTPLYNELKNRKVPIRATLRPLLTVEQIEKMSVEELDKILNDAFTFDHFKAQKEEGIEVTEPDRADGLGRVLYKCPHCLTEGKMRGKGTDLTCHACQKVYHMTTLGEMQAKDGETEFSHIPDWVDWQRECVRREIRNGTYRMDTEVDIGMIVDTSALYMVGSGRLVHDTDGFHLTGCDGKLDYTQKPLFSYSLNADYYWYEIGDIIGIGGNDRLYYCFPKGDAIVTKARFAAEELFKLARPQ